MTMQPQDPSAEPLRVFDLFDLFDPGKPDPVTEAEVAAHHAAYDDPRSYDAKKAWREAHPDQPSPVHRSGLVLGALFRELEPDPDEPVPFTLTDQAEAALDADPEPEPEAEPW